MPFRYAKKTIIGDGACAVEDALPLLDLLNGHPDAALDLGRCVHLHTAVIQVLLAARRTIKAYPKETFLAVWLPTMLGPPAKAPIR